MLFKLGVLLCPVMYSIVGPLAIWQALTSSSHVSARLLDTLFPVACVLAMIGGVILWRLPSIVKARLVSEAKASDYLLCWHCGYDLRGLSSPNKCPECGEQYNHKELMDLWRRWCERKA